MKLASLNIWSDEKCIGEAHPGTPGTLTYEPVHEITTNLGFRPDLTQTRLYSHRGRLEA